MFYYIYICLLSVHIHLASPVPPSHPPTLFLATPPHLLLGLPYPVVGFAGYMLSSSCEYLLFIFCVNVLMIFAFKHELIAFDFFKYLSGAPHTLFCQYPEMGVVILWHQWRHKPAGLPLQLEVRIPGPPCQGNKTTGVNCTTRAHLDLIGSSSKLNEFFGLLPTMITLSFQFVH